MGYGRRPLGPKDLQRTITAQKLGYIATRVIFKVGKRYINVPYMWTRTLKD